MRILILALLIICVQFAALAQINPNSPEVARLLESNAYKIDEARRKIARLGISEEELTKKLKSKGYDLNNLSQSQLLSLESAVDASINELEREKQLKIRDEAIQNKENKVQKKDTLRSELTSKIDQFDYGKTNDTNLLESLETETLNKQEEVAVITDSLKLLNNLDVAIFGQQYFTNTNYKLFQNPENVVPADDYILGPGDNVRVVIFGRSIYDSDLEVDPQGYIDPTTLPKIYLKGITWAAAKKIIESRFKQRYSFNSDQIAISLKKSKVITVSIFGEVNNPGSITNASANTAFNLIVLAKGLTKLGSVRNIQIITPGGGSKKFDIYKSMLTGTAPVNIYLQTNDIIHVPVADIVVEIKGAITRPYKYEMLANETVVDLINYAGGFTANAFKESIQILRYENDAKRLIELPKSEWNTFKLNKGDVISIFTITDETQNGITVSGEVDRPGDYAWREGIKINEIIIKSQLKRTSKTDIAFVQRLNSDNSYSILTFSIDAILNNPDHTDNFTLQPYDKVLVLAKPDFTQYYKVFVSGAVRNPGEFDYDPNKNLRISNLIMLSNGYKPDAIDKAYLIRTDSSNYTRSYITFNLKEAMEKPGSDVDFVLQPMDRIVVLSNSIINTETYVSIHGAVQNPGKFKYGSQMTLLDAITLSGGFTFGAASNKVDVYRVIMKNNEPATVVAATFEVPKDLALSNEEMLKIYLEPYDIIEVRSIPKFELQKMVNIKGEVKYPGLYALIDDNETIYSLIQRAGGLNPEAFTEGATLTRKVDQAGYVIIELDKILKNPTGTYNIALREYDELFIPKHNELVTIKGAVNIGDVLKSDVSMDKINVAFHKGKSVKKYINEYAGGFADNASLDNIYVENSNGKKARVKRFLFFRTYPKVEKGSTIFVGYKPEPKEGERIKEKTDWTKLIADSVAQATAILTLVVLINTINKN